MLASTSQDISERRCQNITTKHQSKPHDPVGNRELPQLEQRRFGLHTSNVSSVGSLAGLLRRDATGNTLCRYLRNRDLRCLASTSRAVASAVVPKLWRSRRATTDYALELCLQTMGLIAIPPLQTDREGQTDRNRDLHVASSEAASDPPSTPLLNNFAATSAALYPAIPTSSVLNRSTSCSVTLKHPRYLKPMFDYSNYLQELDASEFVSAGRISPHEFCRFLSLVGQSLKTLRLGFYLGQGRADVIALYCPHLHTLDLSRTFEPSGHEEATAYISHLLVRPPDLRYLSVSGLPLAAHVLGLTCRAFPNLHYLAFGPPTDPDGEYGPLAETIPRTLTRLHAKLPLPLRSDFLPQLGKRCVELRELEFEEHTRGNIPPHAWVHHCEATHVAVTACSTAFPSLCRVAFHLSVLDLESVLGILAASCPMLKTVEIRVGVAIKDYFLRPNHIFASLEEIIYIFEPSSAPGVNQLFSHCQCLRRLTLAGAFTDPDMDMNAQASMIGSPFEWPSTPSPLFEASGSLSHADPRGLDSKLRGSGLVTEMDLMSGSHRMNREAARVADGNPYYRPASGTTSASAYPSDASSIQSEYRSGKSQPHHQKQLKLQQEQQKQQQQHQQQQQQQHHHHHPHEQQHIRGLLPVLPKGGLLPPGWSTRLVSKCKHSLQELRLSNCGGISLFDLVHICRCSKLYLIDAARIWMPIADVTALTECFRCHRMNSSHRYPWMAEFVKRHDMRPGGNGWPPTALVSFRVDATLKLRIAGMSLCLPLKKHVSQPAFLVPTIATAESPSDEVESHRISDELRSTARDELELNPNVESTSASKLTSTTKSPLSKEKRSSSTLNISHSAKTQSIDAHKLSGTDTSSPSTPGQSRLPGTNASPRAVQPTDDLTAILESTSLSTR